MQSEEIKKQEGEEQPQKSTEVHTVEDSQEKQKREDQERTKVMKRLFVEHYGKYNGIVRIACEKIGIDRKTYYKWKDSDPEFVKACEVAIEHEIENAVEVLKELVHLKKDPASVRFYLERMDPRFRKKAEMTVITGERTLEDLLREDEDRLNAEYENNKNKQGALGGPAEDPGQAQGAGEVPAEQSAGAVLAEKDAPQPDPQSPTEGAQ